MPLLRAPTVAIRRAIGRTAVLISTALALLFLTPAIAQRRYANAQHPRLGERPPQFLLLSYDATPGPNSHRDHYSIIAETIREITHGRGHITLFLNAQFFMLAHDWHPHRGTRWYGHPELYQRYLDPQVRHARVIRYAHNPAEIEGRIRSTRALAEQGNEMASHGTRHADGREWSEAEWRSEFDEYESYMRDVVGIEPPKGFRAPFLHSNGHLFAVERDHHMLYDASHGGTSLPMWPHRMDSGVWEIAIPMVLVPRIQRTILAFDDSYFIRHVTERDLDELYAAEFERRYRGSRAPMIVASHGNYTPPSLRLARVCRRPDVRCATYRELADYMTAHPELAGRWQYSRLAPTAD